MISSPPGEDFPIESSPKNPRAIKFEDHIPSLTGYIEICQGHETHVIITSVMSGGSDLWKFFQEVYSLGKFDEWRLSRTGNSDLKGDIEI